MKIVYLLILVTGCTYAQIPKAAIRRDSVPDIPLTDIMPNARPSNSFYRSPKDPKNVVRATLDNMPIKVPDSSTNYTMMQPFQLHANLEQHPQLFLKPLPRVTPKKFK